MDNPAKSKRQCTITVGNPSMFSSACKSKLNPVKGGHTLAPRADKNEKEDIDMKKIDKD